MEYNGIHPLHPQILHKSTKKRQIKDECSTCFGLSSFRLKSDSSQIQAAGQIDSLHPAPSLTIAWPGTGTSDFFRSHHCRHKVPATTLCKLHEKLPWLLKSTQFVPYGYNTHRYILYTVCIYIYIFIYLFIFLFIYLFICMVYVMYIYIYTVYVNIKTIKYMVYVHAMILRRHMQKTPKKRRDHLGSPEITWDQSLPYLDDLRRLVCFPHDLHDMIISSSYSHISSYLHDISSYIIGLSTIIIYHHISTSGCMSLSIESHSWPSPLLLSSFVPPA